jgi:hypothetical protein
MLNMNTKKPTGITCQTHSLIPKTRRALTVPNA